MSLTGGHLDALLAAGSTAEQIVALVKADMASRDIALAARREKDAERQRLKRSRGVTRTVCDKGSNDRDILTSKAPPIVISDEITPPIQNSVSEVSPENVIEAWNVMADEAGVPKAKMTPERRKKLKTFVKRYPPDDITEAIWAVPRTPFLRGENPRGWKANIDFMLQPSSFTKIIEGTYGE